MAAMSKFLFGILGVLVVAGFAVVLVRQQQTITPLRGQVQEAAQWREEITRLEALVKADQDELERARREREELVRLRGEVAALRRNQGLLDKSSAQSAPAANSAASNLSPAEQALLGKSPEIAMMPAASWTNAGLTTPDAAFQTLNWAVANRDTNVLGRALIWDAVTRAKAETLFAALPESVRQQYGSVDAVVQSLWLNQASPITAFRVLVQFDQGPENSTVVEQHQFDDGRVVENSLLYRRDASGWRQVLGDGVLAKFEAYIINPPGAK